MLVEQAKVGQNIPDCPYVSLILSQLGISIVNALQVRIGRRLNAVYTYTW